MAPLSMISWSDKKRTRVVLAGLLAAGAAAASGGQQAAAATYQSPASSPVTSAIAPQGVSWSGVGGTGYSPQGVSWS